MKAESRTALTEPYGYDLPLLNGDMHHLNIRLREIGYEDEANVTRLPKRLELLAHPVDPGERGFNTILCQFKNRQAGSFSQHAAL